MSSRTRVLMTSTSYPENEQDWRGRFIANIVEAMARIPDLDLSVWAPPGDLPAHVSNAASPDESLWLDRMAKRGGIAAALRTNPFRAATNAFGLIRRLRRVYRRTTAMDVVHVNWLQNALPLWGLTTPAIITVLGTDYGLLRHTPVRVALRAVARQRRCIIAPNAAWMVPPLHEMFGDVAGVEAIPFGVDPGWFRIERSTTTTGRIRWLVVSRVTTAKMGTLFDWGTGLFNDTRELHLLGPNQEELVLPSWIHYHGPTNPDELATDWFPQSAGLITLSQHDEGRPQVILEAMAAGLPVIASDLPAHRDIIQHGSTGWLVHNATELNEALRALEDPILNRAVGQQARNWVAKHIGTWDDCVRRYEDAYHRLIS